MSMYGILAQYIAKAEGKRVDSKYDQILIDTLTVRESVSDIDFSDFTTKYYFTQRYLHFLQNLFKGNSFINRPGNVQ